MVTAPGCSALSFRSQQQGIVTLLVLESWSFYVVKIHRYRQSIVKTVDSDLRIYWFFLHWPGRAQYKYFSMTLHG